MVDAGQVAAWYQDRVFRNLTCKRIQVEEIWAFVYAKQKNVAPAKSPPGDVWTWTAIDADAKLIPSWFVGGRESDAAMIFTEDLASRLANRVQLTSDGHKAYLEAVERAASDMHAILAAWEGNAELMPQIITPSRNASRMSLATLHGMSYAPRPALKKVGRQLHWLDRTLEQPDSAGLLNMKCQSRDPSRSEWPPFSSRLPPHLRHCFAGPDREQTFTGVIKNL